MPTSPTSGPGGGSGATAPLTLTAPAATDIPLTVVGAAGQSTDLLEVNNSSANSILQIGPTGRYTLNPRAAALAVLFELLTSAGHSAIKVEGDGAGDVGTITLRSVSGGIGLDGPEVDIGSSGVGTYCFIGSRNVIFTDARVVPADGDLSTSDFALWLDPTPAATKLMVKAKDSAGTVVTAAIALA